MRYDFHGDHRISPNPHAPDMIYPTTFDGGVYYGPATGIPGDPSGLCKGERS